MNYIKAVKRIWHFLVHEDSWASFVADAVIVVLFGYFVIYPGLGLIMGTNLPMVAVVSSSMDHHGSNLDEWWAYNGAWYEKNGINKTDFNSFFISDGFNKGDAFAVKGTPLEDLKVGDVIVYNVAGRKNPIIHRIVSIGDGFVETKGDANFGQMPFEYKIYENQIEGKAVFVIPKIGWVKVGFLEIFGLI